MRRIGAPRPMLNRTVLIAEGSQAQSNGVLKHERSSKLLTREALVLNWTGGAKALRPIDARTVLTRAGPNP
eukprot:5889982-Prymnesium_polylepis.1